MKPKIVVIGLSGQSVFMKVDHFHVPGETLLSREAYYEPGGKGFNQAVAARRLGGDVEFISAVGGDAYGRRIIGVLQNEGITPLIKICRGRTALAFILTDRFGENKVTVAPGVSGDLTPYDIEKYEENIAAADVVMLQSELPQPVNQRIIDTAARHKVPIIFDPAPPDNFSLYSLAGNIILTPNEYEASCIFGFAFDKSATMPLNMPTEGVHPVITLGSRGALLPDHDENIVPGINVTAADTTGAGDVFNGALAVEIGFGSELAESVKFAVIASGLSVKEEHVLKGIPTRKQVLSYKKLLYE